MEIVTGHKGVPHVTSWQARDINQAVFGNESYLLSIGEQLAATIVSNNEISIADGALIVQGCLGVIQKGTSQSISIANGAQGMYRNDLICAQYTKDGATGEEALDLVVIQGTPSSSPSDPTYASGDIQNGATLAQVPLYRVTLNGFTLESVTLLMDVLDTRAEHRIDDLVITRDFSITQTVAGYHVYSDTPDVSVDGYQFLGVTDVHYDNLSLLVVVMPYTRNNIIQNYVQVVIYNLESGEPLTINLNFKCLYMKI